MFQTCSSEPPELTIGFVGSWFFISLPLTREDSTEPYTGASQATSRLFFSTESVVRVACQPPPVVAHTYKREGSLIERNSSHLKLVQFISVFVFCRFAGWSFVPWPSFSVPFFCFVEDLKDDFDQVVFCEDIVLCLVETS